MNFNIFSENNFKKVIVILVIVFMLTFLNMPYFSNVKNMLFKVVSVQPAKELTAKDNNIITAFFGYEYIMKDSWPEIKLPTDSYEYIDGIFYLDFAGSDFAVKNCADGIIKNIGYKDNNKYIEVLHSGNIKSVYYGLDVIGVNTNLKVKKGDVLSTVQNGKVKFYLTYNDEIVTNYTVVDGELVWQN